MSGHGEFSIYWTDPAGNDHCEREFVDAETAVEFAADFTRRPAAALGVISRLIITDGGDNCCLEWKFGKGITYPPEYAGWVWRDRGK